MRGKMKTDKVTITLKWVLFLTIILCFGTMVWMTQKTYEEAPPIPKSFVNTMTKNEIFNENDIINGKAGFQKAGLMDYGSIYGMGSEFGQDYTAQYLHELALNTAENISIAKFNQPYASLSGGYKAIVEEELRNTLHNIKLNQETVYLPPELSAAIITTQTSIVNWLNTNNFNQGFTKAHALNKELSLQVADFFIYSALTTVAYRPWENISYTNNWPYDPLVGNVPDTRTYTWSWISVVAILFGFGLVLFIFNHYIEDKEEDQKALDQKYQVFLKYLPLSNSQRALWKYFLVVAGVLLLQIACGAVMAHAYAERAGFYGFNILEWVPFSFLRAVHIQSPIVWIGIAWISSGLFMANMITGKRDLKWQPGLINFLFIVSLIIVVGAFAGNYLGIMGIIDSQWFFFGNQGLSYLEMGRFWQMGFFIGLVLWSMLVIRNLWPDKLSFITNSKKILTGNITLEHLFALSTLNIAILYSFGMIPLTGIEKSFTISDYWRWWVVHLWVEESFEFFTICATAYFLMGTGLISRTSAERAVFFEAILVFISGVIGTGHHYYWVGESSLWIALGSTFSILEVLPLILLVIESSAQIKKISKLGSNYDYKVAYLFIAGSAFWNFIGAGVFGGGAINIPIINYFEHGTFLTLNHAHSALFGAFGLLGLGLIYFCLRYAAGNGNWSNKLGIWSFWLYNLGLILMMVLNLLPVGYLQFNAVIEHGFAYARSLDFYNTTLYLQWLRIYGDIVFALGAVVMTIDFLIKFKAFFKQNS